MIRPGDGKALAYLFVLALTGGLGMAFGRASSDALFFKRFGVEYLPHMFFLTSVLLVLFSTVYVEFTDRVRPARMSQYIALVLALFLLLNWAFMARGAGKWAFAVYFLGVSVAAEILTVHFNLYVSQFFDFNQSKRLNPLIDAGSRLGRVLGGLLLVLVAKSWPTEMNALLWAGVLLCGAGLMALHHRGEPRRPRLPLLRKRKPFADVREGLRFARHSSLLQWTGAGVFLLIVLSSVQDYVASTIIANHYPNDQALAAFFGWFFAFTNGAVLLLQVALTSRLVRRFGVKIVSLIFPCSTALSFGLLAVSASFVPALIARFNYMGMMPAFRAPVFNLFYTALPKYIQGRARALVVGLILPVGMGCAGLVLLLVPKAWVGQPLACAGLLLALLYLYVKTRKNKAYSASLLALIQRQVFSDKQPGIEEIGRFGAEEAQRVAQLLRHADDLEAARSYAGLLVAHAPESAAALLLDELHRLPPPLLAYLLRALAGADLAPEGRAQWRAALNDALRHESARVRIAAAALLEAQGAQALLPPPLLTDWLRENNPKLQAQAARILLQHPEPAPAAAAERALAGLLQGEPAAQICALNALAELGDAARREHAGAWLQAPAAAVRAAAVRCCAALGTDEAARGALLRGAAQDPAAAVRIAAAQALGRSAEPEMRLSLLQELLRDREFAVRRAAQLAAARCMPQTSAAYAGALTAYGDQFPLQRLLCRHLAQSPLAGKNALLESVAQTHLRAAQDKKALALQFAQQAARDLQFLALVLEEDVLQHVELVLEILSLQDPSGVMGSVQAALRSENRRLRAQALESLRNVADTPLLRALCAFLDVELDHAPLQAGAAAAPVSGREALQWCADHGSAWLRQCAAMLLRGAVPEGAVR